METSTQFPESYHLLMRKFYSVLTAVLLSFSFFTINAAECSVTLNIDNPANVSATLEGEPLVLAAGDNVVSFEGDGYIKSYRLEVCAVGEDMIIESVVSGTEGVNARPVQKGVKWEMWLYEENDGNLFSVTTRDMGPSRTATCNINILDIGGGISASRGNHAFTLQEGRNTVRFDPESETEFVFTLSSWVSCHTFTVNGVDVEKSVYEYTVNLADGDDVVIAVYDPVNTIPVTINVNPEGKGAVKLVEVNHVRIDSWEEFTVKAGEKVGVTCDLENYNVKSLKVNGVAQDYAGYVSSVVDSEPLRIDIEAAPWGDINFIVRTNIPEAVKMYYIEDVLDEYGDPDTKDSERFNLVAGENSLVMPERGARLVIVPRYGYASDITDGNGTPLVIEDNIVTDVHDGMLIEIHSEVLEYDSNFAVFVSGTYGRNEITSPYDEPTVDFDFACYAHAWSEDWTDIEKGGYTVIPAISRHEIQWLFALEGCHRNMMEVYLNDTPLQQFVETGTWGDWFEMYFIPADGDVLRFYPAGTPDRFDVTFDIAQDAASTVILADHVAPVTDFGEIYRAFGEQEFVVIPAEGATVTVDGAILEPDGDGRVIFTPENNCTLAVGNSAGVGNVAADAPEAGSPVYNMQGMRMHGDFGSLPAGVYVAGGRKFVKKSN